MSLLFCFFTSLLYFFKIPLISDIHSICLSLSDLFHITQYPPNLSMLLQMAKFCSFIWLSSIPSYINTMSALPIYLLMDAGCFHILAIVNIAAVNTGVCIFLNQCVCYLWMYTQEWNCWVIMVVLFLLFRAISILFSIVAAAIYISTNTVHSFPFLYILDNTCCVLFDDNPSDRCEVISLCGFNSNFSDAEISVFNC